MDYPRFRPLRGILASTAITVAKSLPKLAIASVCGAATALTLSLATPVFAQMFQGDAPRVDGFSNNYPWFNPVPQYQGDQTFRWFMANHPGIARTLSRHPGLLYNANWRSQYPALEQYLENHPYEWQALNDRYWSDGPAETQWGDYDDGQWRDAYWWHQNNPNSFYDNHVNWASLDSRWLSQDGAYDNQRQWHYGEWWYNQNPGWVTNNHPNWIANNRNWMRPEEQQRYRQQHSIVQDRQQRAIDQRQANLEQNRTMQLQDQHRRLLNQQQNQVQQQANHEQRQTNLEQQQSMREESLHQRQMVRDQQQSAIEQRRAELQQERANRQENQHQEQLNQQQNRQLRQASREQLQANREQRQDSRQENQAALRYAHQQSRQAAQQEHLQQRENRNAVRQ